MKREILVTCPLCKRAGFTARGLRAHWCPAKPAQPGYAKHSAPLTREEWRAAVDAAKKKAGVKNPFLETVQPSAKRAAESRLRRLLKEKARVS